MKKLAILLLAILLCVPVCFPAFADMGGPEFIGYSATTKSKVTVYEWEWDESTNESYLKEKGTIPAGTVLKVNNEYNMNGEMYAYFDNNANDDSDGVSRGYVRIKDLSAADHEGYPSVSAYKQTIAVRLRVMDPKGVTLYAGPSATYEKVGSIPRGTELTVDTLNQDGFDMGAWMYLKSGGQSGWANCWLFDGIDAPMAELLPQGEKGTVWVVKDNAVLYDRDGNALVTVPKGEKLTFDAYNRAPHVKYYHVTYQGKSGYFGIDDDGNDNLVACDKDGAAISLPVIAEYTADVYAYPDDAQPIGKVQYQVGEKLKSDFLYYAEPEEYRGGIAWNYIEKDGQKGWIKTDSEKLEYPEDYSSSPNDIPNLFTTGNAKKIAVTAQAAAPTQPETTREQAGDTADADVLLTADAEPALMTDADVLSAPQTQSTESATEAVPATSGRPLSPAAVIGVCIGAAAVLALTAIVTLRLIRRKKGD